MTGTDLCVNKPQSVPVIFEPPCTYIIYKCGCGPRFVNPRTIEFDNEPQGYIKFRDIEKQSDYQLLEKDCAPRGYEDVSNVMWSLIRNYSVTVKDEMGKNEGKSVYLKELHRNFLEDIRKGT